jgi:two-component system sensor histidine kinase/response regulator
MGLFSKKRYSFWYALVGIAVGLVFPFLAIWIVVSLVGHRPLAGETFLRLHSDPLMWIIETTPLFLGTLAWMVGRREERLSHLKSLREQELDLHTNQIGQANAELADEVAERKRIEAVISRAKREWETIFDSVSDLILLTDEQGIVLRCNQAASHLFARPFSELIGQPIQRLLAGAEGEKPLNELAGSQVTLAGLPGWYDVTQSGARREEGAEGSIFLVRDVTERVHFEQEITRQRQFFEALVFHLPVAIIILDLDNRVTSCNPALQRLFGYSLDEVVGKQIDQLIVPEEKLDETHDFALSVAEGRTAHGITHRRTKSGNLLDVEVFAVPVIVSGERVGGLGIYHDVSDIQHARMAAEAADRAKSEFLANMSHEIRTPLNGVMGMLELLQGTNMDAEQQDYLETARQSADALLSLINDILDFSKIEAGRLTLEIIDFDLRTTVEGVASIMAQRAEAKKLELACLIYHNTPSRLRGDPGRLRQVLVNLVGNAIKFTSQGEVVIRVMVEDETETEAKLLFSVTDTGIGIPKDRVDAIFDRFIQVDSSTTRQYGGSGLGLAISKQLVTMMGGTIGVESEPGKGSNFWFTATFEKMLVKEEEEKLPVDLQGMRILSVDDNYTNRLIVQKMLEGYGCRADKVERGQDALNMLRSAAQMGDPYKVALVDMQMPEMDGEQTLRAIKADPRIRDVQVIILTSMGLRGDASRLEALGCSGYLVKPVKQSQLYDMIVAVLNRKPSSKQSNTSQLVTRHTIHENQRKNMRILLAEDNAINQKLAVIMLTKAGFPVDVVDNGARAVDAVLKQRYNLVLMDVQMPELDGLEASKRIRELEPEGRHTPIIALTAHAMQGDRERCLAAGMDDYISKPLQKQELLTAVERWSNLETEAEPGLPEESEVAGAEPGAPIDLESALPRFSGDMSFLLELLEEFVHQLESGSKQLRQAVADGDADQVTHLAHSLKGAAAAFSAANVVEAAYELEMQGRAGDLAGAEKRIARMEGEVPALEKFLADHKQAQSESGG